MKQLDKTEQDGFAQRSLGGRAMMMGSNFMAGIALMGYGGYWLDQKFNPDSQRYMIIGFLLGLLWGAYEALKLIRVLMREDQDASDGQ